MTRKLGLHEPLFSGNEWKYVKDCLDSGWVSSAGPYVELFEKKAAERAGVAHAVATVNGTAALHLALRVLGVGDGDEVLVPSLTFIATANAVVYQGAVPHFIDVEPATYGLDPAEVARFLEKGCRRRGDRWISRASGRRVAAIMPMHALGHPADIEGLLAVSKRSGIPLIEDAAEAMGSTYRGKALGGFGAIGVWSFNGNKTITCGGGGMLLTDDAALARAARHLSTQAKSDTARFWHDDIGFNYRLPNINAALGCAQLERLDEFVERKRAIAAWYREELEGAPGLSLVWEPAGARSNFWLNTIRAGSRARAEALLAALNAKGFQSRPLWAPCHKQPPLKRFPRETMRVTETLWRESVNVPSSPGLTRTDVRAVCRAAASAL